MKIPNEVREIVDTMLRCGFTVALVGGCVRDSLLERKPNDFDIVTSASLKHIKSLFNTSGGNDRAVFINTSGGRVDISSYAEEGKIMDRESFAFYLNNDLGNRDFTINSMAVIMSEKEEDEHLFDPVDGFNDLVSMVIYTEGDIDQRLKNDPLRMMRAVRFVSNLDGFFIDYDLKESIKRNAHLIDTIVPERIREELEKILMSNPKGVYNGLYLLRELGLLKYILPELDQTFGFEQNSPHHFADVFGHTVRVVASSPPDPIVRFSALFHDIGKPDVYTEDEYGIGHFYEHHKASAKKAVKIMDRLKFGNDEKDTIKLLVREHMSRFDFLRVKSIKRFINRVGVENLERLFSLQVADVKSSKHKDYSKILELKEEVYEVLNRQEPMSVKDLSINGRDLLDMGYEQGEIIGKILKDQLEFVLDNPSLNQRDLLLSRVADNYPIKEKG